MLHFVSRFIRAKDCFKARRMSTRMAWLDRRGGFHIFWTIRRYVNRIRIKKSLSISNCVSAFCYPQLYNPIFSKWKSNFLFPEVKFRHFLRYQFTWAGRLSSTVVSINYKHIVSNNLNTTLDVHMTTFSGYCLSCRCTQRQSEKGIATNITR